MEIFIKGEYFIENNEYKLTNCSKINITFWKCSCSDISLILKENTINIYNISIVTNYYEEKPKSRGGGGSGLSSLKIIEKKNLTENNIPELYDNLTDDDISELYDNFPPNPYPVNTSENISESIEENIIVPVEKESTFNIKLYVGIFLGFMFIIAFISFLIF